MVVLECTEKSIKGNLANVSSQVDSWIVEEELPILQGRPVSGNSISDLRILDNKTSCINTAIWLMGGRGVNATNNSIIGITQEGNSHPLTVNDNTEKATGNEVVMTMP